MTTTGDGRPDLDERQFIESFVDIAQALRHGPSPQFGSAVADEALMAFTQKRFIHAVICADRLVTGEFGEHWELFAGVLRARALRFLPAAAVLKLAPHLRDYIR